MEKKLYEKLRKEWDNINKLGIPGGKKHNTYYKLRPGERKEREKKIVVKHFDLMAGKSVVEIGCNAGYLLYHIAEIANSWIGIERDAHWHAQALATAKYIKTPGVFLHCTIEEFARDLESLYKYDTLFGANILYYLSDLELKLLQENVMSKCDLIVLISREDKPHKAWNSRDLGKAANIKKLIEECGHVVELLDEETNYVTVVGRK